MFDTHACEPSQMLLLNQLGTYYKYDDDGQDDDQRDADADDNKYLFLHGNKNKRINKTTKNLTKKKL